MKLDNVDGFSFDFTDHAFRALDEFNAHFNAHEHWNFFVRIFS